MKFWTHILIFIILITIVIISGCVNGVIKPKYETTFDLNSKPYSDVFNAMIKASPTDSPNTVCQKLCALHCTGYGMKYSTSNLNKASCYCGCD